MTLKPRRAPSRPRLRVLPAALGAMARAARRLCSAAASAASELSLPVVDLRALDWRRGGVGTAAERAAALAALRRACEAQPSAFTLRTESVVPPALVSRCYGHTRAFHALPDAEKAPYHHSRDRNGRCARRFAAPLPA